MTYEMYHNIFMICSVSAGVMGLVTIILFFLLRIPAVIGELTGVTARKGIEEIRNGNVKKSQRKHESKRNKRHKKEKTDRPVSGMMQSQSASRYANTEKLSGQDVQSVSGNETISLYQNQQLGTAVLSQNQQMGTALLAQSQGIEIMRRNQQLGTTVLQNQETETALLGAEFEVLQDITIVHTEESVSDTGHV